MTTNSEVYLASLPNFDPQSPPEGYSVCTLEWAEDHRIKARAYNRELRLVLA